MNSPDDVLDDIVYVAGNPNASSQYIDASRFHHLEEVFEYGWSDEVDTVPENAGTITPETMTDAALGVRENHPNTRMIVHYNQPHNPILREHGYPPKQVGLVYGEMMLDNITTLEAIDADLHNLEMALPAVERLVEYLDGKVVISADHGNGYGEYGVYGHPMFGFAENVMRVPWIALDGGAQQVPEDVIERWRRLRDGSSKKHSFEEQLEHLGYK